HQTACGVADIMMHTLDRYFSNNETDYLTDAIAEALLRDVMEAGLLALAEPDNYIARSEIMWCGSLSHNDLTGLGHAKDFSVHQLGHELSARFDIAHGESLTIMWASWARYVCSVNPGRFANLGRKVLNIQEADDAIAAQLTINDFEGFFRRLGLATSFGGRMGVQSEDVLEDLAARCSWQGKRVVGVFCPIEKDDMLAIYQAANR
ncbi:MAG: iron-containing alcohol dehydrogenase, partial [Oscillospiraceae bacterium]|nr:iron-containing alcohol dehydrogenase [Oscillospiraceae bacterium]